MNRFLPLAMIAPLCCTALVHAGDMPAAPSAAQPLILSLLIENDSITPDRTDRHYTHGTALNIAWQPAFADDIAAALLFSPADNPDTAFGFTAAQLMFTPDDIAARSLITDDEPYAGYLYAGAYLQRADEQRTELDHLQLDLGVIGYPSLAGDMQRLTHRMVNDQRPTGWRHQLQDEPTIQFTYRRKWRLALAEDLLGTGLAAEAIPAIGLSAGTVTRSAELGSTVRLGWNMPNDFGSPRIADLATGEALVRPIDKGLGFYVFGRATARAVQYNHLLDGSEFQHEEHTVRSRPLIGEFEVGLAAAYRHNDLVAELGYSVTFLTDSFYHQRRDDKYASLHLNVAWWF